MRKVVANILRMRAIRKGLLNNLHRKFSNHLKSLEKKMNSCKLSRRGVKKTNEAEAQKKLTISSKCKWTISNTISLRMSMIISSTKACKC